jgi:Tol biopolymer transport system component
MSLPRDPSEPDGLKIAFTGSSPGGADFGVSVTDSDGTNVRSLTGQPAAQSPSWSPDGRQIAFMAYRPDTDHDTLYVMNADGSDVHALSSRICAGDWDVPLVYRGVRECGPPYVIAQ